MSCSTCSRSRPSIIAIRKRRASSRAPGPISSSACAIRCGLQPGQFHRQRFARRRGIKKALTAVIGAFLLQHIAFVDQLLEDAGQRLLGDIEDLQQIRHLHTRMPCHEMQDAVVGPAEAELGQRLVGVACEIAIGEK